MHVRGGRAAAGFTLVEIAIVVAIIALIAAVALPSWLRFQRDNQLRAAARGVANAFSFARARALASGNQVVVAFAVDPGNPSDACGNALEDAQGNPVPVLVFDDGAPAAGNCCLDAGELLRSERAVPGVSWGVSFAAAPAPADAGGGPFTSGSSFQDTNGNDAAWVLFRPDGIPVALNAACNLGGTGSGAGAVYLSNANRDYAVVLNPLGTSHVERYERDGARWMD
jgi:type IV fimbrial biogenesis protein FimT